jgi:hypothetical protein
MTIGSIKCGSKSTIMAIGHGMHIGVGSIEAKESTIDARITAPQGSPIQDLGVSVQYWMNMVPQHLLKYDADVTAVEDNASVLVQGVNPSLNMKDIIIFRS